MRTAQEYTNLLDSCKEQYRQTRNKSSSSRSNHSITQRPSHPLAKHSIPILQPRHLAMRERIGERSNSQRNRSGSSDTNSLNSLNFKKQPPTGSCCCQQILISDLRKNFSFICCCLCYKHLYGRNKLPLVFA